GGREEVTLRIGIDGTGERTVPPAPVVPSGAHPQVSPVFFVSRPTGSVLSLELGGTPVNTDQATDAKPVVEVFRKEGSNVVQLTKFRRYDTTGVGTSGTQRRTLLLSSDPNGGANPLENCQLFSADPLGGDLRQLTRFDEGEPSIQGCSYGPPPGCSFADVYQDQVNGSVVFYAGCDPFRTGIRGSQIFSMAPDGRQLRQLTHTTGRTTLADGAVEVVIPGPIGYSAPIR